MNTSIISSQGQTTVPAAIRHTLGLKPNQELSWQVDTTDAGVKYIRVSAPSRQVIGSLRGISKGQLPTNKKDYMDEERNSWK